MCGIVSSPASTLEFTTLIGSIAVCCWTLTEKPWRAGRFGGRGLRKNCAPWWWKTALAWKYDQPLGIPLADSVIYELHVRGFTRDSSSGAAVPGTRFLGLCDKIPYLKSLGITAVELLPVTEFDETENPREEPAHG